MWFCNQTELSDWLYYTAICPVAVLKRLISDRIISIWYRGSCFHKSRQLGGKVVAVFLDKEQKEETKTAWFESFEEAIPNAEECLKTLSKKEVAEPAALFKTSDKIVWQKCSTFGAEKPGHQY